MLCSPRVFGARGIVVHGLNARRTAFIAVMIILGTCGAGGQTPPLRDPSVAQKLPAPLSATYSVVREGLLSIDVIVRDARREPGFGPRAWGLHSSRQRARGTDYRTFYNALAAPEPAPELIFVLDAVNLSPPQLTQTESAIVQFLSRNSGHLEIPCFLYRLTHDGLFSSLRPVTGRGLFWSKNCNRRRPQLARVEIGSK